jgi:hypothetical protein
MPSRQPPAQVEMIGSDYAASTRGIELYDAIVAGKHDQDLDAIERSAKNRQRAERQPNPPPRRNGAGTGRLPLPTQILQGYYSQPSGDNGQSMRLLLDGVHNRRGILQNAALDAKIAALKANPPKLRSDDRVMVRLDAPLRDRDQVLLGKHAVVERVLTTNVVIRFDNDQTLGRHADTTTRIAAWMLERVVDPAEVTIVVDVDAACTRAGAVRDKQGRVRVCHDGTRYGWASLNIAWDDQR